jgi:hypothetical protein
MFKPFHLRFPKIGVTETRTAIHFNEKGVEDTFLFLELYCDDDGCDCRRVLVKVFSEREARAGREGLLASLSFGWEPEQFYRDWAGYPLSKAELHDLKGPALQRMALQSARADEMLEQFQLLLGDATYVERIKRHYAMFRATVAAEPRKSRGAPGNRAQRRAGRSA